MRLLLRDYPSSRQNGVHSISSMFPHEQYSLRSIRHAHCKSRVIFIWAVEGYQWVLFWHNTCRQKDVCIQVQTAQPQWLHSFWRSSGKYLWHIPRMWNCMFYYWVLWRELSLHSSSGLRILPTELLAKYLKDKWNLIMIIFNVKVWILCPHPNILTSQWLVCTD